MRKEPTSVSEILLASPEMFVADAPTQSGNSVETAAANGTEPDNIPGTPGYNWEKYGYSLITEETFEGGYHEGDYEKDGIIYCGYCHTPKQVLHMWRGELRAFPIHCRCKQECLVRIEKERKQREHLLMAETCRQHALRYPYMHQWTFANDDGGSPQATSYFKSYIAHFEEMRKDGSGMFLFGPK